MIEWNCPCGNSYKFHNYKEAKPVMELCEDGWNLVWGIDTDWLETLPFGTKLYIAPPQRTWVEVESIKWEGTKLMAKLKEKNT